MYNTNIMKNVIHNGNKILYCKYNGNDININQAIEYLMKEQSITRNGIVVNPLTCYNVSTGNVIQQFSANNLATHDGYGFVGGDTTTLTFDFGTKVANSVVECPLKFYRTFMSSLQPPTNINADYLQGFWEQTTQAELDKLKTQDSTSTSPTWLGVNNITQIMVELDLTPVATQLFGGSNSALKSALKTISVDVWAKGSGSNGGVLTNGVKLAFWDNTTWGSDNTYWGGQNTTGSIAKISNSQYLPDVSYVPKTILTSTNKMYFMVYSTYPSNGTIPSTVSLDYVKITINLNKVVDTVIPKSVYLPKKFAMLFQGVSANFISTSSAKIIGMFYKDDNNRIDLRFDPTNKIYCYYRNNIGSTLGIIGSSIDTNKNKVINSLITYNGTTLELYVLYNNGSVQKFTTQSTPFLTGIYKLYNNVSFVGGVQSSQSDCFSELIKLYDLQAIGKSGGFTDTEVESILRGSSGNLLGVENKELFDINQVTLHANATRNNGVINLNATTGYQESYLFIPVLPNNRYELVVGNISSNGYVNIDGFYGSIRTQINPLSITTNGGVGMLTTGVNTNYLKIKMGGNTNGVFTFSNISLKLKM